MNNLEQEEYIKQVCNVIYNKIIKMKGIDLEKIDNKQIISLVTKVVIDLLVINYSNFKEEGLFDQFSANQLDNNCSVGELQIKFSEFIGTSINISRYGRKDLSDIEIQLINDSKDKITVIESFNSKTIQIKNNFKELRFQDNILKFYNKTDLFEFMDINDISLKEAITLFRTGTISDSLMLYLNTNQNPIKK
jgi:hypothetical protein